MCDKIKGGLNYVFIIKKQLQNRVKRYLNSDDGYILNKDGTIEV